MAILTHPKTWQRPAAPTRAKVPDLAPDEMAAVRRALLFLRVRAGSTGKLAAALGVGEAVVHRALLAKGKPGASLAFRAARMAGVSVEAVLGGAWPPEGACAHCGRA